MPAKSPSTQSQSADADAGVNIAVVGGVLSSDPRQVVLPSGSTLLNYEVSVAGADGRRESVPVAWVDPRRPPALKADDMVVVVGRVRRRFFRAGGSTQSRTEVVASVVARGDSRRADRAVDEAAAALGGAGPSR